MNCCEARALLLGAVALVIVSALSPDELAVIYNTADEDSVAIAKYYAEKRGVPAENCINVSLIIQPQINFKHFNALVETLRVRTPPRVQAYALAWKAPWKVSGEGIHMSITSAVTLGLFVVVFLSGEDVVVRVPGLTRAHTRTHTHTPF